MKEQTQLGDFKLSSKQLYQQVKSEPYSSQIYIHKFGFPNILVKAPKAEKKIHCWRVKTLQIIQYADNKGAREKASAQIVFEGELIFSLLQVFNRKMGQQILEYVDKISNQLRGWCKASIKNVYLVSQKMEESFDFKHGFLKVNPILFHLKQEYYFQYRRWLGEVESEVPQIQNAENVKGCSNYGALFDFIILRREKLKQKRAAQQIKKAYLEEEERKRKIEEQMRQKMRVIVTQQNSYLSSNSYKKSSIDDD